MPAVQFHGIEGVIDGYKLAKMPGWQLQDGSKVMPFLYEGSDMAVGAEELEKVLESFSASTNAAYTLRLFKSGKVTPKDDGSFTFRLNLDTQVPVVGALQAYGRNNEVLSKLNAIDDRLKQLEEDDDEEEPVGWQGQLLGMIKEPGALQALIAGVQSLLMNNKTATSLAGVEPLSVEEAIDKLRVKVPDLSALLVKLAKLAETKPETFAFAISSLRNMAV